MWADLVLFLAGANAAAALYSVALGSDRGVAVGNAVMAAIGVALVATGAV